MFQKVGGYESESKELKNSNAEWMFDCEGQVGKCADLTREVEELKSKKKYLNMDTRCPHIQGVEVNLNLALQGWLEGSCSDSYDWYGDWKWGEGKEAMFYKELCTKVQNEMNTNEEMKKAIDTMIYHETCELLAEYDDKKWVEFYKEEEEEYQCEYGDCPIKGEDNTDVHAFGCVRLCEEHGKGQCVGTSEEDNCSICEEDNE